MTSRKLTISLPRPENTDALGQSLAKIATAGDCLLLRGQIGAGKSALARAFIRQRMGSDTEVPSPTFTLVQTYETETVEIWHADLYRLSDTQEAIELGLVDAFDTSICLVEWPEILGDMVPETALDIHLSVEDEAHVAVLTFGPKWQHRLNHVTAHA